jgi:hypothetical protein
MNKLSAEQRALFAAHWKAERTNFPAKVVEMALGHGIGDKVEAAHRRGDLFDERRRRGDTVVLQRADIEVGLEVLPEFQGAAQLVQFLKEIRGSKRLEIGGETPPDGVGLDNVVDDVVQLFEPVLDDARFSRM